MLSVECFPAQSPQLRLLLIMRQSTSPAAKPQLARNMSAENANSNCPKPGEFAWNELVTVDVAAAQKFYTGLFGWNAQSFPGNADYTLFKQGETMIGGLM